MIAGVPIITMVPQVVLDRVERGAHRLPGRAVPDLLADLLGACSTPASRSTPGGGRRRCATASTRRRSAPIVSALAALEHEQDALPVRVAERGEDAGGRAARRGEARAQ